MMRNTSANIIERLRNLYLPTGFLGQYSDSAHVHVALGSGKIEERASGLHAVIFPLLLADETTSNEYVLTVKGLGFPDPSPVSASY